MYMLLILFMLFLIMLIMIILNLLISKKNNKYRDKMLSFECGFDMLSINRLPFSLQFYLITIIFLIFDVEISLILPMINMNLMLYYYINFNSIILILILIFGLWLEWIEGAFNWFK